MSTITAILEPDADGSLHLPLPEELRHGKVKVVATLTIAEREETPAQEQARQKRLEEIWTEIRARNPFKDLTDPMAWQREMREDRELPGR